MSQYLHAGILLITVPNLIVIALMILGFIIAVAVQLPHPPADVSGASPESTPETSGSGPAPNPKL